MPGLKQSRRLSRILLTKNLARNVYTQIKQTPSLWNHHTSNLVFSLIVNDFGIKYICKEDADHLIKAFREDYEITEECTGEKYLGLTLKRDYANRNVCVSITG